MNSQNVETTKPETSQLKEITNLVWSILEVLIIVFVIRFSIVEPFKIPSTSMVPTLEIGDHILVNKLSYGFWLPLPFMSKAIYQYSAPQRGDVVVFTRPDDLSTISENESDTNIIKRVLALPGETIEVIGTRIYINGNLLKNDWGKYQIGGIKDFGPVTVPEGNILVMGDNRDHSKDSRFWNNPFLPIERVKGRAFFIYWNSELLFDRFFKVIH